MALSINLAETVTIVTGVTSGIGLGVAEVFAKAGSNVVGCARRAEDSPEVKAFQQAVAWRGAGCRYVSCDVSVETGPQEVVDAAKDAFGRVDYVVSNAGRNVFTGVDGTTVDDWNECMRLNLRSHWLLSKAAGPMLAAAASMGRAPEAGSPVFMVNTSNHAFSTIPGCFPYNVAKAGMNALVQSVAIEWGPLVRAIGVAPGFIETEANEKWFGSFPDPVAQRRRTEAMHPVGRLGTTEQVGGVFAFLTSKYAEFMTGNTVLVDGGRSALMQDGMKSYE